MHEFAGTLIDTNYCPSVPTFAFIGTNCCLFVPTVASLIPTTTPSYQPWLFRMLLTAAALAELDASVPHSVIPPDDDVCTTSSGSYESGYRVAGVKSSEHHSLGHTEAINSIEKWIDAALASLSRTRDDFFLSELEPNNVLASEVLDVFSSWYTSGVSAQDVGVKTHQRHLLLHKVPRDNQRLAKCWMRRFINNRRTEKRLTELPEKWSAEIANSKSNAKIVSRAAIRDAAASGSLYHHKQDFTATQEELTNMCLTGWLGDQRVDASVLDALEAGMSIALYLPTGMRGSELKKMHVQSCGYELIQHETSGLEFESLKLIAFETKTRARHVNQFLPHANPWRCGIGLLGLSILVRVATIGPPPLHTMELSEESWGILGTKVSTLDRRIKSVFDVAGVRRQHGDPVTYLGRHLGTRNLQHAGGTSEGGAARRGHSNGKNASAHYITTPLQDMMRLAGNSWEHPFPVAHLSQELHAFADAVVDLLFPQLREAETQLEARQKNVDVMRGNKDRVRSEDHMCDKARMMRAIRFACRVAVCCLSARPRTWRQAELLQDELTLWQRANDDSQRAVKVLFSGKVDAIDAMQTLAKQLRRLEDVELASRRLLPERHPTASIVDAMKRIGDVQNALESRLLAQQHSFMHKLHTSLLPLLPQTASHSPQTACNADTACDAATACETACDGSSSADPPLLPTSGHARLKHARVHQEDVVVFSKHSSLAEALTYAKEELVPREREDGASWRRRRFPDGRQDNSRDKQWRSYMLLAAAVGAQSCSEEEAISNLQRRLDHSFDKQTSPFLKVVNVELGASAQQLAQKVFGL